MPGVICDGNDLFAVHRATSEAAARARSGDGPTLIEFKTFRMRGHEEASGTAYVPPALFDEWRARDPIARFETALDESGAMPAAIGRRCGSSSSTRSTRSPIACSASPEPHSSADRELADVYAPSRLELARARAAAVAAAPEVRYVDAICDALRLVMRRDATTVLIGQDVAEYGGVFKVTKGFVEEFGKARIRNTPIIESGGDRRRPRARARRLSSDRRDAVRRLRQLRLQPDREQPGEDALPVGRAGADRAAAADRRRAARGAVPLAERRELVHRRRRV